MQESSNDSADSRSMRHLLASVWVLAASLTGCGKTEPPAPPVLNIPVIDVIQQDVPIPIEMVGQTLGSVDIPIRARVEGFLESMDFQEGRKVEKDQLLYTIDPRPFEARVVEARGHVAEARTMLTKAKSDLARIKPLAEMKAVSQQDLDSAVAEYRAARGTVQAVEAQLDQAKIELSYTQIHSPIDGRIGISKAKVGEFVGKEPNPVVLNFVSQADPILVRFSINEREYLKLKRRLNKLRDAPRQEPDAREGLELILADGTIHKYRGHIVAFDAAINPTTGTFTLEADFPNPNNLILAGQFARVRGVLETRKNALLVPQKAVSELQGNYRVFVIDAENRAKLRDVVPGIRVGRLWLIKKGLKPGERVAVEGLLRLQSGMQINPQPVTLETVNQPETPKAQQPKAADGN